MINPHARSGSAATRTTSPQHPEPATVLLVDDYPPMLDSLSEIIERDVTLTVVATATRVSDAIGRARLCQPDVAVLDVNMPEGGGWAAARGLREVCPGIRLVAYSSFDAALVTRTITKAGISAYVSKGSEIDVLLAAIHGEDVMPGPVESAPLIGRTAAGAAD